MTTLYGISNCDTVRKARRWLDDNGVEYTFQDYRKQPLDRPTVEAWLGALGTDALVNRRSRTWRELPPAQREGLGPDTAVELLLAHPTLIKRPVLEHHGRFIVGFTEASYRTLAN